ncbi:hypothetical protein Tco_1162828 [Tanacetum coccineum]
MGNDNMTPEDVIREIEYLLNRDPLAENFPNNALIYTIPEMFTDEHTLNYSSLPIYNDANDDLFDLKTDSDEWGKIFYDDPFDSKENKIKVSKLLVDELDSIGSSSFLPRFLECDSVLYEDFSEVDTLTSTDNRIKYSIRDCPGFEASSCSCFDPNVHVTDIQKKDKNEAKIDKTEHGIGKSVKSQKVKVKVNQVKSQSRSRNRRNT